MSIPSELRFKDRFHKLSTWLVDKIMCAMFIYILGLPSFCVLWRKKVWEFKKNENTERVSLGSDMNVGKIKWKVRTYKSSLTPKKILRRDVVSWYLRDRKAVSLSRCVQTKMYPNAVSQQRHIKCKAENWNGKFVLRSSGNLKSFCNMIELGRDNNIVKYGEHNVDIISPWQRRTQLSLLFTSTTIQGVLFSSEPPLCSKTDNLPVRTQLK